MRYLRGEEVLAIHFYVIETTGGLHGVRDQHLFASLLEKPKQRFAGKELYPGIWMQGAAYLEGFAQYHVFVDGNKRTAFVAAARFLAVNGYALHVPQATVVKWMLAVSTKKKNLAQIADWLHKYSTRR